MIEYNGIKNTSANSCKLDSVAIQNFSNSTFWSVLQTSECNQGLIKVLCGLWMSFFWTSLLMALLVGYIHVLKLSEVDSTSPFYAKENQSLFV